MPKKYLYFIGLLVFVGGLYLLPSHYKLLFVSTSSMSPKIPKGTVLLLNKVGVPSLGSVVTYKHKNDALITHRVIKLNYCGNHVYYVTKGDANAFEDNISVTEKDVIGTVLFTFPYLGYVVVALLHPLFLLCFFYIPVGWYFGYYCRRFVNQIIA